MIIFVRRSLPRLPCSFGKWYQGSSGRWYCWGPPDKCLCPSTAYYLLLTDLCPFPSVANRPPPFCLSLNLCNLRNLRIWLPPSALCLLPTTYCLLTSVPSRPLPTAYCLLTSVPSRPSVLCPFPSVANSEKSVSVRVCLWPIDLRPLSSDLCPLPLPSWILSSVLFFHSMFDVGRSMFDVRCSSFSRSSVLCLLPTTYCLLTSVPSRLWPI